VIFVSEKDGTQRLCMEYRVLNEVTSRISTRCLGLMIYLINSKVRVCSIRLIFDQDIIS
jgi:hypothetical protein